MAAAEDSVLKYMADNPGASITEISDAIVGFGADLDTLADLMGVSRADARAAFAPTPAASESDDDFDIMEALGLVGKINSSLSGASSVPVSQSPIIMNATPAGVGPNSPYALSATDSTANEAGAGDLLNTANTTYNAIGDLQDYNKIKDAVALGDASLIDLKKAEGTFAGGLSSVVGTVSGQESKSESIVLDILSANPATAPFALAYRLFDAMDLFGGGGMEATPMTPEERAEYEATTRAELAALGFQEGGEGAGEVLVDAVLQSAGTNVTAEDLAGILGSAGVTADDVGPLYTDQGTAADRGLEETLGLLKAFPAAVDVNFEKDVTQTSSGGGGGDTAASAASSGAASAASSAADSSADSSAGSSADATGGESITLEDLVAYLLDIPTGSNAASSDIDGGFGEGDGTETLIAQLEEAIATETDPLLKAKLELELAKYKNQPTETLEAEVARLEAEAESFISGNPTQIGGNTVFTTDTSGLSDDAENVTLTPGQDITIIDNGDGQPAVNGNTTVLTQAQKDAAFNEVLEGINENTVIADIISAAVEIYGDTADAVVAIANAANDANVSAEDLANATNTSIEAVNQAAATANTTINNQTTAESRAADDDGDGEDESGCTGGKIDDGAGNCVCPEGFSENDSGVCKKDTDILDVINTTTGAVTGGGDDDDDDDDDDGACPAGSGKEKNLAGDCVCPEGKVEDANGVCQADGDDDDDDDHDDGACPAR